MFAFAVLIGLGIAILGKRVQGIHSLLEQGNELMMYLVNLVMKLAPIGTFGLLASSVGKNACRRRCDVQVYDCRYVSTHYSRGLCIWRLIKGISKRKYCSFL